MLRGIGVVLSGLALFIVVVFAVWALIAGSVWWPVILLFAGVYIGVALVIIWLGVFVVHVIVKGVRLMSEGKP